MSLEDRTPSILPPEPELEPLHHRDYQVRAWRLDDDSVLLRGAVEDRKPGLLWPGDPDEPVVLHHMIVDLTIGYPDLIIRAAAARLEVHPHDGCPRIADHYRTLEGLSIARGFTHQVRERFGGPRGCTHTTALLQAMAPVAIQCMWSMRLLTPVEARPSQRSPGPMMRNTCHMWAEDGDMWAAVSQGNNVALPLPVLRRLTDAGVDPADWDA